MIGELIKIGDEVEVTIEKESREWGYNPCPDGTKATVTGFSEIDYGWANQFGKKPGIYENQQYTKLRLDNGQEITEWSGRLKLLDAEEYERRDKAGRNERGCIIHNDVWIRELPHTDFVEGDKVTVPSFIHRSDIPNGVATIAIVHYNWIDEFCTDGITPMGVYSISDKWPHGWSQGLSWEDQQNLQLVERGWVWKYHHGEPIDFPDVESKAQFHKRLGLCTEIRNPKYDLYKWTKEEAVDAIYSGLGHGISVSAGFFFGSSPSTQVLRFNDEELGEQVRQLTMKGFPKEEVIG